MIDELMVQFLVEGRELVAEAGRGLSALALRPDDAAAMDACFRAMHTLKGSTGLFDLEAMGLLLHAAEDRLTAIRASRAGSATDFSALVDVVDQVDRWLDALERDGTLPANAGAVGQAAMQRIREADQKPATVDHQQAQPGWRIPADFTGLAGTAIRYVPRVDCYYFGDDPVAIIAAVPRLTALRLSAREPWEASEPYDPFACNLVFEAVSAAARSEVAAGFRLVADQVEFADLAPVEPGATPDGSAARRTFRVDAARLDRLADLADDLVIAKGGLTELAAQAEALTGGHALGQALRARQARLDRLVGDLHATVGRVRLVPLAPLFGRFPRLVRDIARSMGKNAVLDIEGGEVEVDKAVVDALFDPLLHVLRNAMDHGIEDGATRRQAGKAESGTIRLAAHVAADHVVIEVTDDGAGIDAGIIRDLAVRRGVLTQEAIGRLDEAASIDLIFAPGFSTAAAVTAVSGRGVGMDVVRSAAAGLGGKVAVTTALGQGTTVQLRLPVAMTLTRILVVACGKERFGMPLDTVVEMARLAPERIIAVRGGHAFQLRDQALPLVSLGGLVGAGRVAVAEHERVVIAKVRGELVGFAVDAFIDRMDAAVRPMNGLLARAPGMAGTTLLADGAVLLILDLAELGI
jgi:two-component system chemotaxis sensor kinase CheA